MYFTRIVRGEEVEIFAEDWDHDPGDGIAYGPSRLYAMGADGFDFPLTDDEVTQFTNEAIEMRDNSNPLELD